MMMSGPAVGFSGACAVARAGISTNTAKSLLVIFVARLCDGAAGNSRLYRHRRKLDKASTGVILTGAVFVAKRRISRVDDYWKQKLTREISRPAELRRAREDAFMRGIGKLKPRDCCPAERAPAGRKSP